MSWAALGLGHIFQGGVEDVQVDNVLQLLKVEKGGLGRNRYRGTNMIPIFHLNKRDKALPEKGEDFVEHVIFPILNAAKDFAENPSSTSPEHVSHRVTSCLGEKSGGVIWGGSPSCLGTSQREARVFSSATELMTIPVRLEAPRWRRQHLITSSFVFPCICNSH